MIQFGFVDCKNLITLWLFGKDNLSVDGWNLRNKGKRLTQ